MTHAFCPFKFAYIIVVILIIRILLFIYLLIWCVLLRCSFRKLKNSFFIKNIKITCSFSVWHLCLASTDHLRTVCDRLSSMSRLLVIRRKFLLHLQKFQCRMSRKISVRCVLWALSGNYKKFSVTYKILFFRSLFKFKL